MSDRETIVQTLTKAHSRIRRNQFIDRIASGFPGFVGVAILVKLTGLFILLSSGLLRTFWFLWFSALIVFIIRNLQGKSNLQKTAGDLDRRAHLRDEVLSAYCFLNQRNRNPWMELQIERAAKTVRQLDVRNLYSQSLPKSSYVAAAGIVLLIALNFAPLPFTPNLLFSTPMPDLDLLDRQEWLNEIEALLAEAEAISAGTNEGIAEFQALVDAMRDANLALEESANQTAQVEDLLDEGNLNLNNMLEGLEEMGSDLERSVESAAAGEALSERALQAAAEEFERLAAELGGDSRVSNDLQEALDEAGENSRSGLEELAEAFEAAADALGDQDAQSAEQALNDAAESLGEISDMVTSQQLQNQAAKQMEALREALRQQESQQGQQGEASQQDGGDSLAQGEQGQQEESDSQSGDPSASTPQEGQGNTPQEGFQPGSAEGASEFSPGQSPDGASSDQTAPPISGDLGNMEPTGSGDTPTGLGFSPAQKTGDATSLEVQLLLQTTLASAGEEPPEPGPELEEEATRQERSSLDYRNVPSELTPAQQELLNQERIPREYQNVIKEYFQVIRPQP